MQEGLLYPVGSIFSREKLQICRRFSMEQVVALEAVMTGDAVVKLDAVVE